MYNWNVQRLTYFAALGHRQTFLFFINKINMTTRKKWVLVIVMLSYLVTAIDCSILFTGETKIAADLKLGQSALSWVQNAYVLAYGGFMLLGGRLGDSLGRKRIFCWALVLFGIGSLLAGLSQSIVQMVAARLLQGLGAAVLAPSALALLIDYFKGKERVTAICVVQLGVRVGYVHRAAVGRCICRFSVVEIWIYCQCPAHAVHAGTLTEGAEGCSHCPFRF